jgi:hypothetical protein
MALGGTSASNVMHEIPETTQVALDADKASEAPGKERDRWDKAEIIAKIVAGISIPLIGLGVTWLLSQESERNRDGQFQLNLTQARETADTDLRAKMFEFLLSRFFALSGPGVTGKSRSTTVDDLETERTMLRMLVENFPEHFSSRSLFSHLYQQVQRAAHEAGNTDSDRQRLEDLKNEMLTVGRNTITHQVATLPLIYLSGPISVPLRRQIDPDPKSKPLPPQSDSLHIALYNQQGLTFPHQHFQPPGTIYQLNTRADDQPERFSIVIGVEEIRSDAAEVEVVIFKDIYEDKTYKDDQRELQRYSFDASFFSTPYVDNTKLPNGTRFAVLYQGCLDLDNKDVTCVFPIDREHNVQALFQVVTFNPDFLSLRDRPAPQKVLRSIQR